MAYSTKKSASRAGVGQESDLDKRCKKQLEGWREGFAQSEMERQEKAAEKKYLDQERDRQRQTQKYMEAEQKRRDEQYRQRYEEYYRKSQDAKGLAVPSQP